ncbi:hypothetical protein [Pedobacter antarcticus]|uniref:hypothetical protein n=1 Tax=Pedobacter antarcticus TaxID=34086 RepID=UPI000885702E|nr:hypothetical protein [Pedobacter antarcticus]SDM40441.1 hypothetical protein SAMN04488084_106166 [Pedobacter antarcticus]
MKNLQLSPEVAAKFTLKHVTPGKHYFNGYGEIDLTTLKLDQADHLVKSGFPFLIENVEKIVIASKNKAVTG